MRRNRSWVFPLLNHWVFKTTLKPSVRYIGGTLLYWLSLLQNFIQESMSSGSEQIQVLLVQFCKFAIVRASDKSSTILLVRNEFTWHTQSKKNFKKLFLAQPTKELKKCLYFPKNRSFEKSLLCFNLKP